MSRARLVSTGLLASALACGLLACRDETRAGDAGAAPEDGLPILGSLPEFSLTDQNGRSFGSQQLAGRPFVADFVFTRCPDMCPMLTAAMSRLSREASRDAALGDVHFVSISVDPEHDTPAVLADYAERVGADRTRWSFLTGGRKEIWQLSREGFRLPVGEAPPGAGAPILHTDKFVLADAQGRIRGYYDGLETEGRRELMADLRRTAGESSPPAAAAARPAEVTNPPEADAPAWLGPRASAQKASLAGESVFHGFRFAHRLAESGIGFVHRATEDSGKKWIAVHYDHGNSIAVADVDGDGLHDLYFVNQLGNNELWRNLGQGRFEDFTWQSGARVFDRVGVAASFGDIDNDGDPDLYVTSARGGNLLFENDGQGHFQDITEAAGVGYVGHSSGAVFFDYNRDGLLDLFVTNVGRYTGEARGTGRYFIGLDDAFSGHLKPERFEQSILYENRGENRFEDVSARVGLTDMRWSGDATPGDFDGDGWTDLYVLNMQGLDEVYRNVQGQRFQALGNELFPRTSWGAMGIKAFDFDNDGDQDLLVTDMHSDMTETVEPGAEKRKAAKLYPAAFLNDEGRGIYGNAFYRNDGDGKYVEISDEVGAENFWPWGPTVGDLNADGYQDVFIASSMNYPWRYGVNSVLLNDAGRRFVDAEFALGVEPRPGNRTVGPWFELDCAGADRYHRDCPESGGGPLLVKGALGSRSAAIFDLDRDGDLDIVTAEFHSAPMVLISDLTERRPVRFLEVVLEGTRSNRDGLGARVEVRAGSDRYAQVHDGQSGYLTHSLPPLYFGLADHAQVDEIRVTWPSGQAQVLPGPIEVNTRLSIRESP